MSKVFTDSLRLGWGHSILMPNIGASAIQLSDVGRALEKSRVGKENLFFLFGGGGGNNFNNYFPNVTAEDLMPQDGEFIYPVFRALSEVVVRKSFDPVDFTKNGVLKKSMTKLIGQSVYPNHDTEVGNEIGSIMEATWQEAYQDENGNTVPAGINIKLKIDGKANPKIARGINMSPPSIHSGSVGVTFKWEKSHPDMEDRDFRYKVGTFDEHGELIRRVATEVTLYDEYSLVKHGADPYAQRVNKDGKIVNPTYANQRESLGLSDNLSSQVKYHFVSFKSDEDFSLTATERFSADVEEPINNLDKVEQLQQIAKALNLSVAEGQELTLEAITGAIQELQDNQLPEGVDVEGLQSELQTANDRITELEAREVELSATDKALLAFGKDSLTELRTKTVDLVNLLMPDSDKTEILSLINNSDLATVKVLHKQYEVQADGKLQLTCQDCNSTNVQRRTSKPSDEGDKGTAKKSYKDIAMAARRKGNVRHAGLSTEQTK